MQNIHVVHANSKGHHTSINTKPRKEKNVKSQTITIHLALRQPPFNGMVQFALMFQSSPDGRNRITKRMAKQVPTILSNQFRLASRESLLSYSLIQYIFRFPCHLMSCIWFI